MASKPTVQTRIIEELRLDIVEGRLLPGQNLPTRIQLCERFGTSSVTVQRAVDLLVEEGFLVTRPRKGTFVASTTPNVHTIAVVFPFDPPMMSRSPFYTILRQEAIRMSSMRQLELYYGVQQDTESKEFKRLLNDVKSNRLAGILFVSPPTGIYHTSLWQERPIPLTSFSQRPIGTIPVLTTNYTSFFSKALEHIAACGKKRVGILTTQNLHPDEKQIILQAEEFGLTYHSHWLQHVVPAGAANCIQLLMHRQAHERPDSLIIADDSLVETVLCALVGLDLKIPDQLELVTHANFPLQLQSLSPISRIGFDCCEMLQSAFALLDAQNKGKTVPEITDIPARTLAETKSRLNSY